MKKKADWSKETLEKAVKTSNNVAECLRSLGLISGSNQNTFWKYIGIHYIDTSHFEVKGGKKHSRASTTKTSNTSELLVQDSPVGTATVKKRILQEQLIDYKCFLCGLEDTWNDQPIVLHLDHINGDNRDNRLQNLRFLCPNCHSQTDTYCGKNSDHGPTKKVEDNHCIDCGISIHGYATRCASCAGKKNTEDKRKIVWPEVTELIQMVKELGGYKQVGRKLGVSDNAVRKHIRIYSGPREA